MAGTGGKREGAGRPKGAAHKRNQEVLEKAIANRMTPLEVMLEAMYTAHNNGDMKEAATYAKDAAPYCHAKLQSTEMKATVDATVSKATKEQKDAAVAAMSVLNASSNA